MGCLARWPPRPKLAIGRDSSRQFGCRTESSPPRAPADRPITAQPFAGRCAPRGDSKALHPAKATEFLRVSYVRHGTAPVARRSARRKPHGRARQRARSNDRAHKSRGAGADDASTDAAPDADGPPLRRRGRDPGARRGLRRRGVRRAGPHRGRGLARVPRRASGAFVAEPPARARSEALRDAAARLACVDTAPRPAPRAARPPPPVVLPRPRDRHRHRRRTGTAPRPPRRPTPTSSRRTPRARLHS